jgi:hypothetical protein
MRKGILQLSVMTAASVLLTTGCINSHRAAVRQPVVVETHPIVVTEAPPAPRHEVVGVAPDEKHVWVDGYWMRSNNRWMWVAGHWEVRPRTGAAWVPGHWDKNLDGRGWSWTPGHWE